MPPRTGAIDRRNAASDTLEAALPRRSFPFPGVASLDFPRDLMEGTAMITTHNLGYPRIGLHRELKSACERYWSGRATLDELNAVGKRLRAEHWRGQERARPPPTPVNGLSLLHPVVDLAPAVGGAPSRV